MNGRFLENIIRKKKRNTADLALDSGVPDKEIRKIIEENAGIKFDYAYKLCKALDIPLSSLCDTIPDGLAEMIEYPMFSLRTIRLIKENCKSREDCNELAELINAFYVLTDDAREQIVVLSECMAAQKSRKKV